MFTILLPPFYMSSLSPSGLFKTFAVYLGGVADNDKSLRIKLENNTFQLGDLGAGDNAKQNLASLAGVTALSFNPGYPAAQFLQQAPVDLFTLCGNNCRRLGQAQPFLDRVNHP